MVLNLLFLGIRRQFSPLVSLKYLGLFSVYTSAGCRPSARCHPVKTSSTLSSGPMPRGVNSSSIHTRLIFSSGSSGFFFHSVLLMRVGEYSLSRLLQKLSSLSFARFQDLLDSLLVDAS